MKIMLWLQRLIPVPRRVPRSHWIAPYKLDKWQADKFTRITLSMMVRRTRKNPVQERVTISANDPRFPRTVDEIDTSHREPAAPFLPELERFICVKDGHRRFYYKWGDWDCYANGNAS